MSQQSVEQALSDARLMDVDVDQALKDARVIVIQPDDVLVIEFPDNLSLASMARIDAMLGPAFAPRKVVVIGNGGHVRVLCAEDQA